MEGKRKNNAGVKFAKRTSTKTIAFMVENHGVMARNIGPISCFSDFRVPGLQGMWGNGQNGGGAKTNGQVHAAQTIRLL
jgi:hypothetical protein